MCFMYETLVITVHAYKSITDYDTSLQQPLSSYWLEMFKNDNLSFCVSLNLYWEYIYSDYKPITTWGFFLTWFKAATAVGTV